jgi:hypothetical protein
LKSAAKWAELRPSSLPRFFAVFTDGDIKSLVGEELDFLGSRSDRNRSRRGLSARGKQMKDNALNLSNAQLAIGFWLKISSERRSPDIYPFPGTLKNKQSRGISHDALS